jgi:hypothetical protein
MRLGELEIIYECEPEGEPFYEPFVIEEDEEAVELEPAKP